MAKDPALLFYTADFLTGTQFFTMEQRGKYITLLCSQHITGRLREKDMLKICETYDEDIFDKFHKDEHGLYYNERLETEMTRRKAYSESRSKNRAGAIKLVEVEVVKGVKLKANTPKNKNNISVTHVQHVETETETITITKNDNEIIEEKQQNFKIDVWVYLDEYGERALTKFYNYWSEVFVKGKNKGLMRWEGEPTWELNKRLVRFREGGFDNTGTVGPGAKKPVFTPASGGVSKVEAAQASHEDYLKKYEQGTDNNEQ